MQIIGHRGAKGLAPENSLEAIRAALKLNVDMIEVDLRMQGSTVVLSHDKTEPDQIYCPLAHALKEVDGKIPLNLEIKEQKVVKHLKLFLKNYPGKFVISSKKFSILQDVRKAHPTYELAVIEKWSGVRGVSQAGLLGIKRIHMNHRWLWGAFVKSVVNQGFKLYAYTVNDLEKAKELEEWGVSGIFTDYPDKFLKTRGS